MKLIWLYGLGEVDGLERVAGLERVGGLEGEGGLEGVGGLGGLGVLEEVGRLEAVEGLGEVDLTGWTRWPRGSRWTRESRSRGTVWPSNECDPYAGFFAVVLAASPSVCLFIFYIIVGSPVSPGVTGCPIWQAVMFAKIEKYYYCYFNCW